MQYSNKNPVQNAHRAVSRARLAGLLADPRTLECVDCGKQAHGWEHHKGYEPENRLEVRPVCAGCNVRRGLARKRLRREAAFSLSGVGN